jgi:hypothetical protein
LVPIQVAHAATDQVDCNNIDHLIRDLRDSTLDFLSLEEGCIYNLTAVDASSDSQFGNVGLPRIKRTLTIKGNGATIRRMPPNPAVTFRILQVDPGGDLTLSDLTIDNGNAAGNPDPTQNFRPALGGGIFNLGTLKVNHITLSRNHADFGGAGIENGEPQEDAIQNPTGGSLTLSDSVFFDNSGGIGAAIGNGATSTMNLTGCTIFQNTASSEGGGVGNQGTGILNKCTISGNTTTGVGGGIVNGGQLFLTDSPVTGNHAIADNSSNCRFTGLGGGIHNAPNNGNTVTLIRSPVTGNEAIAAKSGSGCNFIDDTGLGGGILNAAFNGVFGIARLTDSDVSGNSAASGGGIANVGPMTLTRSNVTGNNSTGDGGGIFNLTDRAPAAKPIAALTLTDSDVTDNHAGGDGGGIFNQTGNKVTLNQSTVTGNTPDDF